MMVEVSVTSPPSSSASSATSAQVSGPKTAATTPAGSYGRVAAWLSKRVEVALGTVDLTLPQYRVMGILTEGSSAASGLADRMSVQRPSITALVDGLVAKGLVDRRQEDSDRRKVSLRLTDEGRRILTEADRVVDDYLASLASHLPSKDETTALRSFELWGRAMVASREAAAQTAVNAERSGGK
jgi:long-chain acyl-CoA synthetase